MRLYLKTLISLIILTSISTGAVSQSFLAPTPIPSRPDPEAIVLSTPPRSSILTEQWQLIDPTNPTVRNVTLPTLTPVLPDPKNAIGAAVIVAPGGGFMMLSMETEGFVVARALADRGIAAFVLKYRIEQTDPDPKKFAASLIQRFTKIPAPGEHVRHTDASADALAAVRLVRARSSEWKVNPKKVGIIGFSAGAMTALELIQTAEQADMPAFIGYIYGPQNVEEVPPFAPPLFDALALDDPLFGGEGFKLVAAWRNARRPVELHAYQRGGHGFGLGKSGTTSILLIDQFVAWLDMQGILRGRIVN